ncbi:MAG TPA: redox-regulated ATPase YchF [Candidatus Deferrimicrobium sp.]|nr:redox-regulated ATPase YchF [Candidatus Deferrimicrobium sp.]
MLIGLVGKPSSGKTSFLNAACMTTAKVGNYPFTTIEPNPGTAYVAVNCPCKELGVKDNPNNSICVNGKRLIPINLLDVAGLVPGAWEGKGLGNKFLDDLRRTDALINIVDAAGTTDAEGQSVKPGSWDPLKDIEFLDYEIIMWFSEIIKRDWRKFTRRLETEKIPFVETMVDRLSGLGIIRTHILHAVKKGNLNADKPSSWSDANIETFVKELLIVAKPMVIVANKMDLEPAKENIKRMKEALQKTVVPTCTLGEYWLRRYAEKNVIDYQPGNSTFTILQQEKFSEKELQILNNLKKLLTEFGSLGVQQALNFTVFEILDMIPVYPVHDVQTYSDQDGRVLPDVYLVNRGITLRKFAGKIHTDFEKFFIHGIDARTKRRLGENYELKEGDIVKIVSAK